MSKSNYRRCVHLGVTGFDKPTCFPSAIDKLLPGQRIEPDLYRDYGRLMRRYSRIPERQRNPALKKMYALIAEQIDAEELLYRRVRTAEEFKDVVHDSHRAGMEVIIEEKRSKEESHAMGLEIVDRRRGHYRLASNNIPVSLRGVITLDYLFPELIQPDEPPRVMYPWNDTNLTLIPAA